MVLSKSDGPSEVVEAAQNVLLACETHKVEQTLATSVAFLSATSAFTGDSPHSAPREGEVLLVENHYDIRTTISSALDRSGFRVTGVESHAAALCQAEARDFDVFLLNRLCPDGMGLSLCRQLRDLYPLKPIVIYSTAAITITQEQREHAAASAYLTEPGHILNPGPILLKLLEEAKASPGSVDSKVVDEMLMLMT